MPKKIICTVIGIVILLGTTGCLAKTSDSPYDISRTMLRDIQKYLQEENAEEFCKLFAKDSEVTIQEVENLFSYIGKIESFDQAGISPGGASTNEDGRYIEYAYTGRFTAVAESGIEYKVAFSGTAVYDEKPEHVGLCRIGFSSSADSDNVYGVGAYYNENGEELDLNGEVVERTKRKDFNKYEIFE